MTGWHADPVPNLGEVQLMFIVQFAIRTGNDDY